MTIHGHGMHCPTCMACKVFVYTLVIVFIDWASSQNINKTKHWSHLIAKLKAWFAELLVIFPVFGILRVQESGKSVRALGDTELEEATHPLNEKAHQSCIIKRGGEVGEEHKAL